MTLTIFFLRKGLPLNAIIGGDGNICFRCELFLISLLCSLKTLDSLDVIIKLLQTQLSFCGCGVYVFLLGCLSFAEFDVFDVVDYLGLFVSSVSVCELACVIEVGVGS